MKNRIMIVEDDRDIRESLALNLELSGYEYKAFEDGGEAMRSLEADAHYDLALLDVMLPGMDGFLLLSPMRAHNIPVIFLTAKADLASRVHGLRDGAEDYIVKPFEMLELLVRIEKVLERTGKGRTEMEYHDVHIDLKKRSVTRNGELMHLQPLEFDLLVMFLRLKNCTLTRDRLLNEVWGYSYYGGTRTVDTHVAKIRKLLGLNIVSVPKVGYRLED